MEGHTGREIHGETYTQRFWCTLSPFFNQMLRRLKANDSQPT